MKKPLREMDVRVKFALENALAIKALVEKKFFEQVTNTNFLICKN